MPVLGPYKEAIFWMGMLREVVIFKGDKFVQEEITSHFIGILLFEESLFVFKLSTIHSLHLSSSFEFPQLSLLKTQCWQCRQIWSGSTLLAIWSDLQLFKNKIKEEIAVKNSVTSRNIHIAKTNQFHTSAQNIRSFSAAKITVWKTITIKRYLWFSKLSCIFCFHSFLFLFCQFVLVCILHIFHSQSSIEISICKLMWNFSCFSLVHKMQIYNVANTLIVQTFAVYTVCEKEHGLKSWAQLFKTMDVNS